VSFDFCLQLGRVGFWMLCSWSDGFIPRQPQKIRVNPSRSRRPSLVYDSEGDCEQSPSESSPASPGLSCGPRQEPGAAPGRLPHAAVFAAHKPARLGPAGSRPASSSPSGWAGSVAGPRTQGWRRRRGAGSGAAPWGNLTKYWCQ
jgi:hypothetical protein